VLCPGDEYDRSPCGTGTSAKLACLAARGQLQPGEVWTQESVIGGRFRASYRLDAEGRVVPSIRGRAYVCAEAVIVRQPEDPFRDGIDCR
jgi:4-hydroxyproline epimerase